VRRLRGDEGVYAILYAVLVVVLLGMAALVVDIATLRADKRDGRTAADNAALAGAADLGAGPWAPRAACDTAWRYALQTLGISSPTSACSGFPVSATSCPSLQTLSATAGGVTIGVTWPVPRDNAAMTTPDGLPDGSSPRVFNASTDGSDAGCDRLAVTILRDRPLGLGAALGVAQGTSHAQSVARFSLVPKSKGPVAALNILNLTDCKSLSTGGQGNIVVNRSTSLTPGIIEVESAGTSGCSINNNKYVIDVSSNNNNRICASGPSQVPDTLGTCDGQGRIKVHALDSSTTAPFAYVGSPGQVTAGYPLSPTPIAEGGYFQWDPVTADYGCYALPSTTVTKACSAYPPYIKNLYTGMLASPPTPYNGVGTYSGGTYSSFTTLSDGVNLAPYGGLGTFSCVQTNALTSSYYVPPGAWYVNCPDGNNQAGFQVKSNAIFGGGEVLFEGGVQVAANGACLSVNTPLASLPLTASLLTCPTTTNPTNEQASTQPPPSREAIVFIRGSQGFTNGSSGTTILLPQTLVAQKAGGLLGLGGGAGTLLWTAPGGGTVSGGHSTLDTLCTQAGTLDQTCLDSHFSKTAYWNETLTTGSETLSIKGQGSLSLVGTFFAPRGDFVFSGQAPFYATNAQVWVDTLALSGITGLGLTPDTSLSFNPPEHSVALIR
jgi:hypothetical protein